jgi:hypothetical protein
MLKPIVFACLTALSWGLYGPMLGKARVEGVKMSGFKAYLGIGLAYMVIAIIGAVVVLKLTGGNLSFGGNEGKPIKWGFIAGALGAIGALCLTGSLVFAAGKTHFVMPIVFAGAVSVNALTSAYIYRGQAHTSPLMWVGILGVVVSTVFVAMNIPHAPKKAAPATTPASSTAAQDV